MIARLSIFLLMSAIARAGLDTAALDAQLKSQIAKFPGKVSLYAKNLETGRTVAILADEPVRTASTIKLPIMIECFYEASEGKLKLTDPLTLTDAEKVSGSGVLQDLSDGVKMPIRDFIDLMIVLSDNTATNIILNRIGGSAVNARMAQLGLEQTRVMRKILGNGTKPTGITEEGAKPENQRWGTGRSSPHDMVILLEKLYKGALVNKSASDEMLKILKRQRDHNGIGRDFKDIEIASKSGALDHLRSGVGIIYSKGGPIAIAITVEDIPEVDYSPDNPGDLLIAQLSKTLMGGLAR